MSNYKIIYIIIYFNYSKRNLIEIFERMLIMENQPLTKDFIPNEVESFYSPVYLQYLQDLEVGDIAKYGGTVPSAYPYEFIHADQKTENTMAQNSANTTIFTSFESKYDKRGDYMTPVKRQARGDCWAFAGIAVAETIASKESNKKYIYSEEHYRIYFSPLNRDGFFYGLTGGANMAEHYYSNWVGPVFSTDAPYDPNNDIWNPVYMSTPARLHITGTEIIESKKDAIKTAIVNYGGAHVHIHAGALYGSTYYNAMTSAYYIPTISSLDHEVLICGWDDGFDINKFNPGYRPNNNGAWLIKNSWGSNWSSENGYFWMSYETPIMSILFAITDFRTANNEKMYSHDIASLTNWGSSRHIYMCNVYDFTKDYTNYGIISDIMFYSGSEGCNYSIYIVPTNTDGSPPNITSLPSSVASGTTTRQGHITVTLPTPYIIPGGGKYAIIIEQNSVIPSELYVTAPLGDKTPNGTDYHKRGDSWRNEGSGWTDLFDMGGGLTGRVGTFSIKAIVQPKSTFSITYNPYNSSAQQIPLGRLAGDVVGSLIAVSSDTTVLTTDATVTPAKLYASAIKSGPAAVGYLTAAGIGRNFNYQVYDPNGIVSYTVPGGKMSVSNGVSQPIGLTLNIGTSNNPITITPAYYNLSHSNNNIKWTSTDPNVVSIDTNGVVTAVANGFTIIIGEVADKWGMPQTLVVPVQVGSGISAKAISVTFNPYNPNAPQIPLGGTAGDVVGSKIAISSDTTILTTDASVSPAKLYASAIKSGFASVLYLTSVGSGRNFNYQVYDPNGIVSYTVPGGKMSINNGMIQPIGLVLYIGASSNPIATTPASYNLAHPNNKIKWTSTNPNIASVDTNGVVTATANGYTVILGAVADKWGMAQTLVVPVQVGL